MWVLGAALLQRRHLCLDADVGQREWTPDAQTLAGLRTGEIAGAREMIGPAGEFLGSDRKVDKNSYLAEFPRNETIRVMPMTSTSTKSPPYSFSHVLAHNLAL